MEWGARPCTRGGSFLADLSGKHGEGRNGGGDQRLLGNFFHGVVSLREMLMAVQC